MTLLITDLTPVEPPAMIRTDVLSAGAAASACDRTTTSDTLVIDTSEAVIIVAEASGSLIGGIDVTVVNGPADADHAAFVSLVRRFAAHLLRYATDYEAAWTAETAEEQINAAK